MTTENSIATAAAKEAANDVLRFDQQTAIDFFVKTMEELVPEGVTAPTGTYKQIGAGIVKTIHAYIAPLIYAANQHRHPVDVLGTGTDLIESEPSDLQLLSE